MMKKENQEDDSLTERRTEKMLHKHVLGLVEIIEEIEWEIGSTVNSGQKLKNNSLATFQKIDFIRQSMQDLAIALGEVETIRFSHFPDLINSLKLESSREIFEIRQNTHNSSKFSGEIDLF